MSETLDKCWTVNENGTTHNRWVCEGHDHDYEIDLTELGKFYERAS